MANDSSSSWGFLLFAFALYAWGSYQDRDESTVYFAYCNVSVNGIFSDESSSQKATYKASFDNQTVVTWSNVSAPESLGHCAVANAKNWQCHVQSDSTADTFEMSEGKYSRKGPLHINFVYAISGWKWWWFQARDWVKPYLAKT